MNLQCILINRCVEHEFLCDFVCGPCKSPQEQQQQQQEAQLEVIFEGVVPVFDGSKPSLDEGEEILDRRLFEENFR